MLSPSSNNGDNDAWLMKIDLKREEPMRVNKDERIKKATEDQAPAAKTSFNLIITFLPQLRSKLSR